MEVVAQYQIAHNRRVQIRQWSDVMFSIATQQDAREVTYNWMRYKPDGWRDCTVSFEVTFDGALNKMMEHIASEKRYVQKDTDAPHWNWRC